MAIKVVFIDIDNTLLSFSDYVKGAMKDGFFEFNLKPYSEDMFLVFEKINNSLWRQVEDGTISFEEVKRVRFDLIFKELKIDFEGRIFEEYFRKKLFDSAIPEPGAIKMLEYLSGKYVLAVASNGPYEQQINRLKIGKMYDFFSYFFISTKIGAQKPTNAFFEHCFKEIEESNNMKLLPSEAMIIGDSLTSDIKGGSDFGMKTCYYLRERMPKYEDIKPDFVIENLEEISDIL